MSVPHRFSSGDRRQQILEIATEMFAAKGFSATTTREIAARAQVNEALIFRHFPSKDDLYWAVLEAKVRSENSQLQLEELLAAPGDIRTALAAVAEWILRRRAQNSTTTRLSLFCALERHDLSQRFFGRFVSSYFEALADYLRQQMRRGVLRSVDPLVAARSFVGAVAYHSLLRELFGSVDTAGNMDAAEAGKLMVSIWLDGMSVTDGQGETPGPSAKAAVAFDGAGVPAPPAPVAVARAAEEARSGKGR
jgi:AcrR family transcriptional regulator